MFAELGTNASISGPRALHIAVSLGYEVAPVEILVAYYRAGYVPVY